MKPELDIIEFARRLSEPDELWESTILHVEALESGIGLLVAPTWKGRTTAGAIWATYHNCQHPEVDNPGLTHRSHAILTAVLMKEKAIRLGLL